MFAAFIAVCAIVLILFSLADPAGLLQVFLLAGVVLYAWYANRFEKTILRDKRTMTKKQKDWLQVNAIVAAVFCLLGISNSIYVYYNPHIVDDLLKQMPLKDTNPQTVLMNGATFLLVLCTLLLVHIIWTYILVRKHKDYFSL